MGRLPDEHNQLDRLYCTESYSGVTQTVLREGLKKQKKSSSFLIVIHVRNYSKR